MTTDTDTPGRHWTEAAARELAEGYSVGRVRPDPHWIQRGGEV